MSQVIAIDTIAVYKHFPSIVDRRVYELLRAGMNIRARILKMERLRLTRQIVELGSDPRCLGHLVSCIESDLGNAGGRRRPLWRPVCIGWA